MSRFCSFVDHYRKTSVEEWLTHIIQERVALEEAVYRAVKQDLAIKGK
jgi:hypothetical protein